MALVALLAVLVTNEQMFSSADNIYDEKRSRLHREKGEKLQFLEKNLPLLDSEC